MKKFDCFTYFNESELVNLRFAELNDFVDHFVVVEASKTFTGNQKPLYFDELELSDEIARKIIRVLADFPSDDMTPWERETYQRNMIVEGLDFNAKANDLVVISDVDEIPNPLTIDSIKGSQLPIHLDVKQFFWNYHWQVPDHCNQGARPVVAKMKHVKASSPQELRAAPLERIADGGWHFSFFGDKERVKLKIESFAHTEYDSDEYKNAQNILYRIENGIDPFDRFPLKYKEIDNTYPRSLQTLD